MKQLVDELCGRFSSTKEKSCRELPHLRKLAQRAETRKPIGLLKRKAKGRESDDERQGAMMTAVASKPSCAVKTEGKEREAI
jgi:hypothetical protein